jgi:hypothetical protein
VSKTYRALAIVAVVATLVSLVLQLTFGRVWVSGWFPYAPLHGPLGGFIPATFIVPLWLTTSTLAAPIVGVFSVIVAAQARRWGWLLAFILLGLFAVYGPTLLSALGPYIDSAVSFRAMGLIESVYVQALPLAILAIVALIFVASARRRQPVADIERTALP